jgi:hypothetical protein
MKKNNLIFDVLIDDQKLKDVTETFPFLGNELLVSIVNDFEDGKWRYSEFQDFIWNNIAETALSARERENLIGNPQTILRQAAKNLRYVDKDKGEGSELAEIVLYGIMRHYYRALPVVPKIFYKQNTQDNAKGADSVHIVITEDNFSLWFGEAKFYNSIEDDRLSKIIDSVITSLDTNKLKKENSIITDLVDIDILIPDLAAEIKKSLSFTNSMDNIKPKIHIPILLLHQCEITNNETRMSDEYKNKIIEYHKERAIKYFTKQFNKKDRIHLYEKITFHLIIFPIPNKNMIVETFLNHIDFYKNN